MRMVAYLDDICVVVSTESQGREHGTQVMTHLHGLGFMMKLEEGCALLQDKQASTWGLLIDRDLMMMISVSREGEEDQKGKETDVEGRCVVSEKTDSFH